MILPLPLCTLQLRRIICSARQKMTSLFTLLARKRSLRTRFRSCLDMITYLVVAEEIDLDPNGTRRIYDKNKRKEKAWAAICTCARRIISNVWHNICRGLHAYTYNNQHSPRTNNQLPLCRLFYFTPIWMAFIDNIQFILLRLQLYYCHQTISMTYTISTIIVECRSQYIKLDFDIFPPFKHHFDTIQGSLYTQVYSTLKCCFKNHWISVQTVIRRMRINPAIPFLDVIGKSYHMPLGYNCGYFSTFVCFIINLCDWLMYVFTYYSFLFNLSITLYVSNTIR